MTTAAGNHGAGAINRINGLGLFTDPIIPENWKDAIDVGHLFRGFFLISPQISQWEFEGIDVGYLFALNKPAFADTATHDGWSLAARHQTGP